MTNLRSALPVLLLAVALAACSGGRADPFSPNSEATKYGGKLTLGGERVNTPVSEDNKYKLCQLLNCELFSFWVRALTSLSVTPQEVDTLSQMRLSGTYAGYALVEGKKTVRADNRTYDFSLQCTLYDFSDSGYVFMGGKITMTGKLVLEVQKITELRLVFDGGMGIAGNYSATVDYKWMKMAIDAQGRLTSALAGYDSLKYYTTEGGSMTLTSGATSIHFNPYFRQPEDGPKDAE